jgi:lysophospholipase L1-like esterase
MPGAKPSRKLLSAALAGALLVAGAGALRVAGRVRTPAPPSRPPVLARDRWGGPLLPAPLVSRGKRVASSPPGGEVVVDGVYRSGQAWAGGFPTPDRPSWVAIRVGEGPRRILVSWTSSSNHDYFEQLYGAPVDYRIETSADSRDGRDGTWRTAASVSGNPVRSRAHAVDFAGQRWVRLVVTRLADKVNPWGLFLDEIDVHDLSWGGDDVWLFLGDSITAGVFDRSTPHQPSFAEEIARAHPGYHPALIDAGLCRARAGDALARLDEILALNPDARVVAVDLGANDGDPRALGEALAAIIARLKAAGRIPVLGRIPFQTSYDQDYVAPKNEVLDALVASQGLLPGPDLYAWFKAHPDRLADGLHPDDAGSVQMSRLWADAVAPLYPR